MAYTSQGFADGQVLSAAKLTNIEQAILNIDVVAQGTSGGWNYVKYANGLAICYYRYNTSIATSAAYTIGVYNSTPIVLNFPFTFAAIPSVFGTTDALSMFAIDSGNRTVSKIGFYVWAPRTGTTSVTGEANLIVIGRWK